jgi:2'-5' RNA ligase
VDVSVTDLVFFPGRAAYAAWRLTSPPLLALQAQVWRALGGRGNPQHEPGTWTPHLSLARRVRPEQQAAVAEIAAAFGPVEGALVAARSYDTDLRDVSPLP